MRTVVLLVTALVSAPAAAQGGSNGADANDRVCRTQQTIGSRLAVRRVCKTRAEWDEQDRAARQGVREALQRHVNPTVDWHPGQPNGSGPGPQ